MRGLTPSEFESLTHVERDMSLGKCDPECAVDFFEQSSGLLDSLVSRGLLVPAPCPYLPGAPHLDLTELGRLALRLARTVPGMLTP
jgi:hypothetical protein